MNKEIKRLISTYVGDNQRNWDKNLMALACALRPSKSETTRYSPYFVNFGRDYIGSALEYKNKTSQIAEDPQTRQQVFRSYMKTSLNI